MAWNKLKNQFVQKSLPQDEIVDNNDSPPIPSPIEIENYYKNTPPADYIVPSDEDDGKRHQKLNFDSSQVQPNKIQQLLSSLGQRFSNNLQNTDKTISDSSNVMMDRLNMKMHPENYGPPVPNAPLPQELAMSNMIGQGVMGVAAPARNVIAKSGPWMKNLTEGSVKEAMPAAEGLANSAQDTIYTQGVRAAQKFQELKNKLGKY